MLPRLLSEEDTHCVCKHWLICRKFSLFFTYKHISIILLCNGKLGVLVLVTDQSKVFGRIVLS